MMKNKIELKANKFLENRYYYEGKSKLNFFSPVVKDYKDREGKFVTYDPKSNFLSAFIHRGN